MSIQNISPSLQAYVNNPKLKQETAVTSNFIEKTDTFTPSNTNEVKETSEINKKEANGIVDKIKNMPTTAKVIGGIAVASVAIGGAFLIFKGKGNKVQKALQKKAQGIFEQSKGIQEEAEKIQQDGQKAYNEVMDIIRQGQEKGFCELVQDEKTIKFIGKGEGEGKLPSTIEEYIGETLSRKSSLIETDGKLVPSAIEEFMEGTRNKYEYNGDCDSVFYKGYEEFADGTEKWAEVYGWVNGGSAYIKDGETHADGTIKYAEGYIWVNGGSAYIKDGEIHADGAEKYAERYHWSNDGKLIFHKD